MQLQNQKRFMRQGQGSRAGVHATRIAGEQENHWSTVSIRHEHPSWGIAAPERPAYRCVTHDLLLRSFEHQYQSSHFFQDKIMRAKNMFVIQAPIRADAFR